MGACASLRKRAIPKGDHAGKAADQRADVRHVGVFRGVSADGGVVNVSWAKDEAENLVLEWLEDGGPTVSSPTRRGFGSRLLDTVVTGELGGQLDVRYQPTGLFARLVIPPAAYTAQELTLG